MSVASEIARISKNVSDSLDAVATKGVTVPSGSTSDDLAGLILQITGGVGGITQDQDGYLVLSPDAPSPTPGGGLEYETGTWTPATDVDAEWISFANSHTEEPVFVLIEDSYIETVTDGSWTICTITLWLNYCGAAGNNAGTASRRYYNGGSHSVMNTSLQTSNVSSYVTNENFRPNGSATGYKWRSGRTYKWIAVWAPST